MTVLFTLFSLSSAFAVTYLDVYATGVMQPGANITLSGQITNTTTSDVIEGINVSAAVNSGGAGYNITPARGIFVFNITAPNTIGNYNVTVVTDEAVAKSKTIPIYVSNMTTGNVTYISGLPPYSPGSIFTINVTLLNGTTAVTSYTPNIIVFAANGQQVSWTVATLAATSDANGVMMYNITIPSSASSGQYAIVIDKGALSSVFSVKSGYNILVNPETTDGAVTLNFAPSSSVMLLAKVQTAAGLAAGSVASSVTAYVTLPNSTIRSVTLQARDQSSYPGFYNNTFSETSASGTYNVRVDAVISGAAVQSYTIFNVKAVNVRLTPQTDFFMEWGGTSAFKAGQTVGLSIVATNLSTDEILTTPTNIPACNSSYLKLVDVFFPNGTSINSTIQNAAFTSGQYMMSTICRIRFTGPSTSSVYGVKVNVTIGSITQTAEGYFSIQKYFLKPAIVAGFGGEMEMMSMATPGENITISLSAYNTSSSEAMGGGNITDVVVKKLVPLKFSLGIGEITNLNYSVSYGTSPTITLTVPSVVLGPTSVEIQASIGGETVKANTFFVGNYLMGFMSPVGAQEQEGGSGGGGGSMPFSSCSGVQTFQGTVMEVKTKQAVSTGAVVINSIAEATEELTGKDVSSCITLPASATSSTNGAMTVNLTFSPSCSFSGFYTVVLNGSYQGKISGMPANFMCKQLNFMPSTYAVGGSTQDAWRISPYSGVNIIISNISRLNDSRKIRNSTVKLPRLFNFNPGKGGERILTPTSAFSDWAAANWINWTNVTFSWNVSSNLANITIYPQNFTLDGTTALSSWPNGFIELQPSVCTESLGGSPSDPSTWSCDTGFGGFQVVSFDAWTENFEWGQSFGVNSTRSYVIDARTNVSLNCTSSTNCDRSAGLNSNYTGSNNTGFTVKIGRPWEGELTSLEATAMFLSDGWNKTGDWSFERWQLGFIIPATVKKGEAMLMITVNNSYGESNDIELWTTLTKYNISLPYDEGIMNWMGSDISCNAGGAYSNDIVTAEGVKWNLTVINQTYGIWSKGCSNSGHALIATRSSFNVTRHGDQDSTEVYNPNLKLLLIDNATAGQIDIIVMNNSGALNWANENNRTLSANGYNTAGIYVVKIEGQYVKVINSSALQSGVWGGSSEAGKLLSIPYVVKLGSNPIAGAEIHANGIALQSDEGKGFSGKLIGGYNANGMIAAGENYSYVTGTTDSAGVGFLKVNISSSGRYNIFWKVNTSSDYDIATFSTGTNVEIKKFKGWGNQIYWLPQGRVVLNWINNSVGAPDAPIWYAFNPSQITAVYNASITESSTQGFVRDDQSSTWYIVYDPSTNRTCLDDDANFTYGNWNDPDNGDSFPPPPTYHVTCFYWNGSTGGFTTDYGATAGTELAVGPYANDTQNNQMTVTFFQNLPVASGNSIFVTSGDEKVSVKACAETYDVPSARSIENANVKLFAKTWQMNGPPQTTWLTLYNPMNDTIGSQGGSSEPSSNIVTGPHGCVAFNMTHPTGWSIGCTDIQGQITSGSNTENIWVTRICRSG